MLNDYGISRRSNWKPCVWVGTEVEGRASNTVSGLLLC